MSVQGTVVRVSPMTVHNTCWPGQSRNQRSFVPLRSSKSNICMDDQMLRIQEVDDEDGGRVWTVSSWPTSVTSVVKVTAGEEAV